MARTRTTRRITVLVFINIQVAKSHVRNETDSRMSNGSPHPSLSPHRMRGEGGFSRVRGVPAHDIDWKLIMATTLVARASCKKLTANRGDAGATVTPSRSGSLRNGSGATLPLTLRAASRHDAPAAMIL